MKKLLLLFVFGQLISNVNSQTCGTLTNYPNKLPTYNYKVGTNYDESPLCVRVFFHIVRNTAGTNGFNAANIPVLVNSLNQAYNAHNIVIVNNGQDFINNDTYGVEFNDGEYNALVQQNNVANSINIYLLPVDVNGSPAYAGKANGIPGDALVVAFNFITTSTLPHELGHCLNLFHTHHQLETGGCDETSQGKGCTTCGDFTCDTPIDPLLSCGGNVDESTCAYTGGGGFTPLTNNIMSYSCRVCRTALTSGQGLRMRISLNYDPLLSNFVTINCINFTGTNPICNSEIFTLNNAPAGSTISWSKIDNDNITTISPSGSTCAVNRIGLASGAITLRCSIITPNGALIVTRDLIIGTGLNSVNYTFQNITCVNNKAYFYANIRPFPGATNYAWFSKDLSKPTNQFVYKDGGFDYYNIDFPLGPGGRNYTVKVVVTTPCGTKSDENNTFYAPICSGSGAGGLRLTINPNPSNGLINLNSVEDISETEKVLTVKIFDLQGNLKLEKNIIHTKNMQLDLRKLPKGNYILKINSISNVFNNHIVIQ